VLSFERSSRVIRCLQASRNGTRVPRQPQFHKHWAGHLLPWAKPEPVEPTWADQDHNIHADVAMLVESHFSLMRTKVASSGLAFARLHADNSSASLAKSSDLPRRFYFPPDASA
jgi:hypothetical protein